LSEDIYLANGQTEPGARHGLTPGAVFPLALCVSMCVCACVYTQSESELGPGVCNNKRLDHCFRSVDVLHGPVSPYGFPDSEDQSTSTSVLMVPKCAAESAVFSIWGLCL
jgi:hypothetical protein